MRTLTKWFLVFLWVLLILVMNGLFYSPWPHGRTEWIVLVLVVGPLSLLVESAGELLLGRSRRTPVHRLELPPPKKSEKK